MAIFLVVLASAVGYLSGCMGAHGGLKKKREGAKILLLVPTTWSSNSYPWAWEICNGIFQSIGL